MYQIVPIKTYNAYREFIFDNISQITNSTPYNYLRDEEDEVYRKLRLSKKETSQILKSLMIVNKTLIEIFNRYPCSFESIQYFNLTNECTINFSHLFRFSLENEILYFVDQLRILKNIVKYIIDNNNIIGNLSEYNISEMINLYNENINNNKTIFRLNLFNNKRIHSDISFMFFDVILHYFEQTRYIINLFTINGKDSYFIS